MEHQREEETQQSSFLLSLHLLSYRRRVRGFLLFRPSVFVPLFNLPFPHFSRSQCKLEEFLKLIQQLENEECAAILFFVSAPSF